MEQWQRNVNIRHEKRINYTEMLFVHKVCNYEKKHARDKNHLYVIKLSVIDEQMHEAEQSLLCLKVNKHCNMQDLIVYKDKMQIFIYLELH